MAAQQIAGWNHVYSGKVRDLYESQDPALSHLILVVASDRISAFDHVLEPAITGKGAHLTTLTNWWFDRLDVPNHLSQEIAVPEEVAGRAMVCKKLGMFPVECVVRGYIAGSGFKEYQAKGSICGITLPEGLQFGDKLDQPVFTPAFKAELGEHDENISFDRVVEIVGVENAHALKNLSLKIFERAGWVKLSRGGAEITDAAALRALAAGQGAQFVYLWGEPGCGRSHLLAALAESFLTEVVEVPKIGDDGDFFVSAVGLYWEMFKPNIGIMLAVDQLAATDHAYARSVLGHAVPNY